MYTDLSLSLPANILVFVLLIGIFTCLIMVIVSISQSTVSLRNMPKLAAAPILQKEDPVLYEDLFQLAEKLDLVLFAKLPLSGVVALEGKRDRAAWKKALRAESVDYVLCDPQTYRPLLVIFPSDSAASLERRHPITAQALNRTGIPFLEVGSYNLPGLEKALNDRLPMRPARPERRLSPTDARSVEVAEDDDDDETQEQPGTDAV